MARRNRFVPPAFIQHMEPMALQVLLDDASRKERRQITLHITPQQQRALKQYNKIRPRSKVTDHGPMLAFVILVICLLLLGGGYLLYLHVSNTPFFAH